VKYYCKKCGAEYKTGMGSMSDYIIPDNEKCLCCGSQSLEKVPYYETIEEWERRHGGKKYPKTAPVYVNRYGDDYDKWFLRKKQNISKAQIVVVATEMGEPPKGWRME
jgi:hypothetical protein